MRAFRTASGEARTLRGGAESLDALGRRVADALERRDSAALRTLALSRAEFAHLYYSTSPLAHPPYDLDPGLMWFQLEGNSGQGLSRLLARRGGSPLGYLRTRCDAPRMQRVNRVHGGCRVSRRLRSGETVEEGLFGAVLERDGMFKVVSYSNDL